MRHEPNITNTHYAILVLCFFNSLDLIDADRTTQYILSLLNDDGSFSSDDWGETDLRFVYCGVSSLRILGKLDQIDKNKTAEYIIKCKNFEGAFGAIPDAESHAAYTFCAVGALAVLDRLDAVDADELGLWLM